MSIASGNPENKSTYQRLVPCQNGMGNSAPISYISPRTAIPELKKRHRKPTRLSGHPDATSCLSLSEVTFIKSVVRAAGQNGFPLKRFITVVMPNATRDKIDDRCRQILRDLNKRGYEAYVLTVFEWGNTLGIHAHMILHVKDGDLADQYIKKRVSRSKKLPWGGKEMHAKEANENAVAYLTKQCEHEKPYGHRDYWLHPLGGKINIKKAGQPIKGRRWFLSGPLKDMAANLPRPAAKRIAVSKNKVLAGQDCLFSVTELPTMINSIDRGKLPEAIIVDLKQKRKARGMTQEAVAA